MDLTANSVETCQYPEFNKDDITLLPQLGFGLMFLYSLGLVIKTGKNISVLLSLKHQLNIQKLMRLNCLVLLMLIINLVYFGDGIASIIISGGYLSLKSYYIVTFISRYLLQLVFTSSCYKWSPLLALAYDFPRRKMEKFTNIMLVFSYIVFLGQMAVVCYLVGHSDNMCDSLNDVVWHGHNVQTLISWLIPIFIASVSCNNIVFIVCCYLVSKKISSFYEFKDSKSIRRMKLLILISFWGAAFRIIQDVLYYYVPQFYLYWRVEGPANQPGASILVQVEWTLALFFAHFSTNLIPLTVILANFSPANRKKDNETSFFNERSHSESETHDTDSLRAN